MSRPERILLVTGLSGAGRTTALKTLEDIGWETVDNLPLSLVDRLLSSPLAEGAAEERPLAVGIDTRTRGFDATGILARVARLRAGQDMPVEILFLDSSGATLARRFSATRRRHPLALDRTVEDGIAQERELLEPLRAAADTLIDTSDTSSNALQQDLRRRFGRGDSATPTLAVMSFGYSRGLPRHADLVFDMRFLRNPHWVPDLRPGTGLDADVAAYVAGDPAYDSALEHIEDLLLLLLPRYQREGKSYVTVAFGCTGGRHRSVHVADRVAKRLHAAGFSPTIAHRDLAQRPSDANERKPGESDDSIVTVSV
ncbi:RNase adapter RapZ [Sphingomonas nostoxanthinifaciens]|uniref:RNase adapter RapZ n=1 Tax=Sphingomonas nostoxanthinifaciens TaxID=2872652 RepID=UPI001CC1D553|nr:RNase adapter RapZ [Sphingomonas nostoxanthinifaciens]